MSRTFSVVAGFSTVAFLLASCGNGGFDPDLRGWIPGSLSTADAAARAAPRPLPDSRGVITFPTYQVAIARSGDTVATVASRLGIDAGRLAKHNALSADAALGLGQTLVLPQRVAVGTATAPSATVLGRLADPFATRPTPAATPPSGGNPPPLNPAQHVVVAGETAWSIARKYNVGVQDLASWNGLPTSMSVRIGQRLIVPVVGQKAPDPAGVTMAPGVGSPTPRPPSAAEPLPSEKTTPAAEPGPKAPATDLGATRTAASAGGRFQMPVSGSIIRVYEKGRNDGIDISATAGTAVKAAGAGTVAAVTKDTSGAPIVVVRHDGNLMTVYTGMDGLEVAKGNSVSAGQSIGRAGSGGFVHFEVRQGFDSVDPEDYLN